MIPLREVHVLDRNAEALGVPIRRLVRAAGQAVADHVRRVDAHRPVLVLCGVGNNAADGLVAARLLARAGHPVAVATTGAAWKSLHAKEAFDALPAEVEHLVAPDADAVARSAAGRIVVDAMLGAGVVGALREPFAAWTRAVAATDAHIVSVDVPTGLCGRDAVVPHDTLTFHDLKEGMTPANSGNIVVADIGIPRDAWRATGPGEYLLYPQGRADQHKGEGGIVLVIGGGPYTGAPAVAGLAALRTGADLAIVLTPQRAWQSVASYSPNLVVKPLSGEELDFDDPSNRVMLNTWLKKATSVVVGPGLGLFSLTQRSVHHVLERAAKDEVPCVVDADGLTALSERKDLLGPSIVVTPHKKEFQVLADRELPDDPDARLDAAVSAAKEMGATWLVKGPVDVITDGSRAKLNRTGHPAMSVGGTGDALAGIVGALLAKGMSPFDAARLGARICGEAGERAAAEKSWGLTATDVVEAIPPVLVRSFSTRPFLKHSIQ